MKGKVIFIGAGPGDPDLITVKGKKAIENADVIIYAGSLVNKEVLDCKKEECEALEYLAMRYRNLYRKSLLTTPSFNSNNNNKDVLDAIKIAIKVSHPDNGGRSEDFIKYRNLYNKIKK